MWQFILSAALSPLVVAADAPLDVGAQLVFRGGITPAAEAADTSGKSFDLTLWIVAKSDAGADVFWLVDERGKGEFPWLSRFGRLSLDARWQSAADGPAVLYDRGEGKSVVPLPLPFFMAEQPLSAGLDLREDKLEFHVDQASEIAGRPVWQISVRNAFGPKRLMMVDRDGPLVPKLTEKVVMGRGDEYELRLELVAREQLTGQSLEALTRAAGQLTSLARKLNLPPRSQDAALRGEPLAALNADLPALVAAAAATPLESVVAEAARDLKLQTGRDDAVAQLTTKFAGQSAPDFSIKGIGDESLSQADLAGKVTVLHFWDYRDEPLQEPYGQVGYLDFLYHQRKGAGLQVFGVAVDGRLADESTRGAGERSIRKLRDFMNLSYPILLDSGSLVKQFGDPRLVGAALPLFVVIGPNAKILHYHVGHYEVDRDQGLKRLDEVVGKALETKASSDK
jgi:peroxiredoxin